MNHKRFARICLIVMLAGVGLLLVLSAQAQEPTFSDTFDDPALPGWEHTDGVAVVDGALRIEPDNFAFHGGEWGDLTLAVHVRPVDAGGIVVSYRVSEGRAYHLVIWPDFMELQRELGGKLTQLDSHEMTPIPLGEWSQIEVSVLNMDHVIKLQGTQVLAASDPEPLPPGGIAFEVVGEAAWDVDDVNVFWAGGPRPPAPAEPVGELNWVRTGGPLGGLGYDVRMRPDNPDIMYVTDAWAGVFISRDGGQTWFPSNEGITTRVGDSGDAIPVFCLTIDPHDYDTIWIGTQNVRGIFKSTDGGSTWVKKDNGVVENEGITFRGLTIDPHSSDIVYAAAEISSWAGGGEPQSGREFDKTKGVVYKTTDGGENWSAVWRGDNLARYVWIDPRDSNVLYVSTGIFDREAANSDHTTDTPGGEGVVKSTDGGQTWQRVNDGLDNLYVGTLFMHPENPDILLAGTGNNAYPDGGGIYLTADGGVSWQAVRPGDNINAVEFATSDPNVAYAGSAGAVYRSEDGGRAWEKVTPGDGWGPPGVRAGFPIDFQVDPRDPDRIFANNYGGGNFLSEDGGRTWTVASAGYTGAQVRAIAVDPTDPARVYAAARSGLYASTDGGSTWAGLSFRPAFHLEWNAVAIEPSNPQHVLAGNNWEPIILLSDDGGQTWLKVEERLQAMMAWRVIAFAPSAPETVYAGSSAFFSAGMFSDRMAAAGVYVSRDGGKTWNAANDALSARANVADLAVDPRDSQVVYAATGDGVLKTSDGGGSWAKLVGGLPASFPALAVAVHPSEPNVVYAGFWHSGLYRSEDGGATWRPAMNGMPPETSIKDVVFDPANPQVVYAVDVFSGVYRSTDGGLSWQAINDGLLIRSANQLAISTDGQHLYAATEGGGVFRLDLSGEPPAGSPPVVAPEPGATPVPGATLAPTSEPSGGGGGICGGAAVLPLAVVGLAWRRRRGCRGWRAGES